MGIGNSSRSDDAAGVRVARALLESRRIRDLEHVLVIDGGHAPENLTGEIRRFGPDSVLLVDAAELGQLPGTVQWIPIEDLDGMSVSTHSLPLSMLAGYLALEVQCTVTLIGIQARSNAFGEIISPDVLRAIDDIVKEVEGSLCEGSNEINTCAGNCQHQAVWKAEQ